MKEKSPSKLIGLISGEGEFPLILTRSLLNQGYSVVAVCFSRGQFKALSSLGAKAKKLRIGQLGKLINTFKNEGVKELLFLGKIDKSYALRIGLPDLKALSLWRRVKNREDDSLLRALVSELEKEGFVVRGPAEFLGEYLTPKQIFTKREPTPEEWEDIRYGFEIAKAIGELDIGQCVVVKDRMTVAVEAMEGTDATILRAGSLRKETVVVKVAKPKQDLRLDLPVVGAKTIETLIKAKAKVLALEAGRTFFLQQKEAIQLADRHQIAIVGV